MEEEDNIIVKWAQEDVETSYNLLNKKNFKNTQVSNVTKIRPMGAELFHADGRKRKKTNGHDEDNSRFSKFFEGA